MILQCCQRLNNSSGCIRDKSAHLASTSKDRKSTNKCKANANANPVSFL